MKLKKSLMALAIGATLTTAALADINIGVTLSLRSEEHTSELQSH